MPDFGLITSKATDDFIVGGNVYLFSHNMKNMEGLMRGTLATKFVAADGKKVDLTGKKGKSLDYALVEFEQTKVQEYITKYVSKHKKDEVATVMKELNASFKFAASDVRAVMKEHFTDKDGKSTFDFKNYDHRVLLGQKLIDKLHEQKTTK